MRSTRLWETIVPDAPSAPPVSNETPSSEANARPLWMRMCLYTSGGLLLLVVTLLVVGMLLPGTYRVERSVVVDAAGEVVHAEVADLRTWPEWTAWNAANYPSLKYEYSGTESGIGAVQSWIADEGNGRLEITESNPSTGIVYEMRFGDHPPMQGRLNVSAGDAGTTVTWIAEGDLGPNPIARWFGLLMDSMMGPDFERGLDGLKQRLESRD